MTIMKQDRRHRRVVIGVDTHKYVHVAVALDVNGGVIDSRSFAADTGGYIQLIDWAVGLDSATVTFAIEGTSVPTVPLGSPQRCAARGSARSR